MTVPLQSVTKTLPFHILVLEDEEAHVGLIRKGFHRSSGTYRLTFAQTLEEARIVLQQDPPDLIVADWLLPDGKGIDILPRKGGEVTLPVVIMTSHGTEEIAVEMLKSGAVDYLIKSESTFRNLPRIADRALRDWKNITERKRAESVLRESNQFLDNIVEHIPDMIFIKETDDLRFVRFNKAGEDLLGYSREELQGKNDYDLFPKDQADFFVGNDREVLETNRVKDIPEERINTRHKGERILHTKKIPIPDEKGKSKYLLGISEDITERKQAQERINLSNRKLALMIDVTYQDIQNKVTALRGYVELSRQTVSENDRIAFINKEDYILESIHHLINITKDYQQMGLDQLRWIPLEPTIRMQASLISGKPNESLNIDLNGLEIYSDPLINRVFYNLIDNAVKHGKTLTHISFYCQETLTGVIVICEDDGIGIPFDEKIRIFDRVVGDGKFGLFFVSEFLTISGMTIIENGVPGKGARFEITVPKGAYRFTGTQ